MSGINFENECVIIQTHGAELTLENWLARGGCPRVYKHTFKFILNSCGTLRS